MNEKDNHVGPNLHMDFMKAVKHYSALHFMHYPSRLIVLFAVLFLRQPFLLLLGTSPWADIKSHVTQ